LREDGNTVAVVGGGPSDLPVMQQANLSIAAYGSSQAALSVADIILLKPSPKVFMKVLEEGQKIVNGLLDVLKLYLTQLTYLVVLILVLVIAGYGFPYIDKQGAIIAIATLTIPSLGLSLWSLPGAPPKVASLGRTLTWFVAPSALAISITGVTVFVYFVETTGVLEYAQLALTHMLIVSGLILAVLIRPPRRIRRETFQTGAEDSNATSRDWRPTALFLGVLLFLLIIAPTRLMYWLFELDGLQQGMDYLIVGLAVLAWVVVVEIVWRTLPPKPYRPR
jgi:magnesium-transporting ATPase (P-type)